MSRSRRPFEETAMSPTLLAQRMVGALVAVGDRIAVRLRADRERGDVPGWVLVTVMTAALVAALGAFARGPLESAFAKALSVVVDSGGSGG
jgi:hypothetical protein